MWICLIQQDTDDTPADVHTFEYPFATADHRPSMVLSKHSMPTA